MPATPAWPPNSTPRLFVPTPLAGEGDVRIEGGQAHYLINVLRLKQGGPVKLFDNMSGEWLAEVSAIGKRDMMLRVKAKLKNREAVPDLWLVAAPIKQRFDGVIEKATELGVARIVPVLTRRSVVDRINPERLHAHMIEAAEQCERTALPELMPLAPLESVLRGWPADRQLFFADERGGGSFRKALVERPGPAAVLIGPEGGFTDEENEAIRAVPTAAPVSLGPRILRADTAAIAAISLWMAGRGDW